MKDNYVWYACYGSNLNRHRFLSYIQGGICNYNGGSYDGCEDKSDPIEDKPIIIPHKLYFGNSSGSWGESGVAFIDPKRDESEQTLVRMYLITEEQFHQVHRQEGAGPNWYGKVLELGEADGYNIKTFTNAGIRPANVPVQQYLRAMSAGLKETYPEMDDKKLEDYYINCLGTALRRVG